MDDDEIVAIALLSQRDVDRLGPALRRVFPVDDTPCFEELLRAIDEKAGQESEE